MKVARPVLRGAGRSNAPGLPDAQPATPQHTRTRLDYFLTAPNHPTTPEPPLLADLGQRDWAISQKYLPTYAPLLDDPEVVGEQQFEQ